jgi:outer membrane biosynthesis protein TonB
MEPTSENTNYLQIKSAIAGDFKVKSKPILFGRFLIGSSENCDVVIQHPSVHAIHAVLEIFPNSKKIYDLTGEGLLKVNGEVVIVKEISLKDKVNLANVAIVLDQFQAPPSSPTTIASENNTVAVPPSLEPSSTKEKMFDSNFESVKLPYLIYPFNSKFNFDQSEYIFEDNDQIFPIFKYDVEKTAVEVMILFKKKIISVDYLPMVPGVFRLAGIAKNQHAIEYAYLSALEQIDFVEYRDNAFFLSRLDGYKVKAFSSTPFADDTKIFKLSKQDIIQFELEDISIVVRYVEAPPEVAKPPVMPRDRILIWLWALTILFLTIPAVLFSLIDVKKEDVEKEKAPERIAKILYKQKAEKVEETKLPDVVKNTETKSTTPDPKPEKKVSLNDQIEKPQVEVQKGAPPKKQAESKATQQKSSAKSDVKVSSSSPTPKSQGHVDVYKSGQFKSTVSSLISKGGSYQGVKAEGFGTGTGASVQGVKGASAGVSTSTVSDKIGDISGTAKGVADFGSGTKGLAKGKQFYSASIPAETVVVGLMDPDIILKILREHIPQFRYCYQREIEARRENIQGMVKLSFSIGASGNVTKAGVIEDSPLPAEVKKCVVNVLYGIQFPRLAAEGVVEVVQPFNFYPKM